MKKVITFDKELKFKSIIGEITTIELEHTLRFVDGSNIAGDLLITGSYKMTEASRVEEKFQFKLPVEINLTETIDLAGTNIAIDDFYYEIENDDTLVCHIDVLIEGVESIMEEKEASRECDGDIKEDISIDPTVDNHDSENSQPKMISLPENASLSSVAEIPAPSIEKESQSLVIKEENTNIEEDTQEKETAKVGSLFSQFKDSEETYSTYSVYIMRENETIESIMDKYKVTKEELEDYNDLSKLAMGSKIIIPAAHE